MNDADGKHRKGKPSSRDRRSAARVAAVQALYQMDCNGQDAQSVVAEFATRRGGFLPLEDGARRIKPDGALFAAVVAGVEGRREDLVTVLRDAGAGDELNEPLLRAVLLCGAYELLACHETDAAVVISEYIDVAHDFFDRGEPRLVNGVLDKVKSIVREAQA